MKIMHWNCAKKSQNMIGIKRYENELFSNINRYFSNFEVMRIQRPDNRILGSTILSWFLTYRTQNADIVHATCQTIAPIIFLQKPKSFLLTILDIVPLIYPSTRTDISVTIQWKLIPHAIHKINRIITISDFTKQEIVRLLKIPEQHISTIYLGVDHLKYRPLDKMKCKQSFGLNPDEKHILIVASNLQHKRMDLAQKVIREIRTRRKDILMIKVGYGEQLKGDGIVNLGWISEDKMPLLYNASDAFLHTSEYEGFGLPILEAMACGVPVVASNRASIPEIVQDPEDLIDISSSDCVNLFVETLLEKIESGVDKAAITQSNKFSWENTAKKTIEIYEHMYQFSKITK